MNNEYYHVIPVKDISAYSQSNYNSQNVPDEFWESCGSILYVTPIAYTSSINNLDVFNAIMKVFKSLDQTHLKYTNYNTPSDFVKKHLISDGDKNIMLCNKHLIKRHLTKNQKPQEQYTRNSWIKSILKELFPNVKSKKNISTNTPQWVINIYNS